MALFAWPAQHPLSAAIALVTSIAYLSYIVFSRYSLDKSRRAFKLRHGCQPAASTETNSGPLGLRAMWRSIKAKRDNKLLEHLDSNFAKFGSTYTTGTMRGPVVMTNDPENIKCALATRFEDWGIEPIRTPLLGGFMGKGIFTTDGAFWQHSRAILRPQFEKSQVSAIEQFEPYVQKLFACIPDDNSTFDLQQIFFKFSMDTSTDFLLADGTDCLGGDAHSDMFSDTFERAMHEGVWRDMLGWAYHLVPHREAARSVRYAHAAVDRWVRQSLQYKDVSSAKERGERYVFVNELARHEGVDAVRIRDEALNIILAGRDTTASLLSSLWFNLARHPEVYEKLQAEVDQLNGEQPTYETLRNMKYLKYTVQETLRLFTPAPFLAKTALVDTVLPHGGRSSSSSSSSSSTAPLFIPAGTRLAYNTHSMMRRTDIYGADAKRFDPSRWAENKDAASAGSAGSASLRPGWGYTPFGGGPRVCLGQQYALTETYYVTVRLMQRFRRLECRDPVEEWVEKLAVTCCSANGTMVGLS